MCNFYMRVTYRILLATMGNCDELDRQSGADELLLTASSNSNRAVDALRDNSDPEHKKWKPSSNDKNVRPYR